MRGRESSPEDVALMQGIAQGDRTALSRLYDKHASLVYSLCLRIVNDQGAAEELLGDIFFELWRRSDRYDAGRGSPLTYIVTLARSRAIDRRRSQRGPLRLSIDQPMTPGGSSVGSMLASDEAGPVQTVVTDESAEVVRRALACLDPVHRQAIELNFFEGLSHSEIAERLDKPLGTVKTHIRQGLIRLRDVLRNGGAQ